MSDRAPHRKRALRSRPVTLTARFFARLEEARIAGGMDVDALTQAAGVSRALYFTLRRGRSVNLERAEALAHAVGRTLAELVS